MYVESCTILIVVNCLSRPIVVLDGLPSLYGFKYDSVTACGLPLYLYSYKLVGSAIVLAAQVGGAMHLMDWAVGWCGWHASTAVVCGYGDGGMARL